MLRILYWNVHRKKTNMAQALDDDGEYDMLALQEVWLNRDPAKEGKTYCPRGSRYNIIHKTGSKAALFIHKRFPVSAWTAECEHNWSAARLNGTTIFSIYSECYMGRAQPWSSPLEEIAAREPAPRCIMVGDFNLHHPAWDRHGRTSAKADMLLALVRHAGLELCTPWGEMTHESREDRDSTIDLAWATADLNAWWEGSRSLEGSDHRAQVVSMGAVPPPASRRAGWSWAQMDREKVMAQATHLTAPRAEDITTDE